MAVSCAWREEATESSELWLSLPNAGLLLLAKGSKVALLPCVGQPQCAASSLLNVLPLYTHHSRRNQTHRCLVCARFLELRQQAAYLQVRLLLRLPHQRHGGTALCLLLWCCVVAVATVAAALLLSGDLRAAAAESEPAPQSPQTRCLQEQCVV